MKRLGNIILIIAIIFFLAGLSSLILERIGQNELIRLNSIYYSEVKEIKETYKTDSLLLMDSKVKELFKLEENQVNYVAVVKLPNEYDINKPLQAIPILLGKIEYKYPENIKEYGKFANTDGFYEFSEGQKKFIQIGMKYENTHRFYILKLIGISLIVIYWLLFGIWASIKAYHVKQFGIAWLILFLVLNIIGFIYFYIFYGNRKTNEF